LDRYKYFVLDVALTALGFCVIVLSMLFGSPSEPYPFSWSLGWLLFGYGFVKFTIFAVEWIWSYWREREVDARYRPVVRQVEQKALPLLIVSDIEGCITPPERDEIDLVSFARLRAYCEYARKYPQYPQLIFFTGRSVGYVELLAQSLGTLRSIRDLPSVVENGAALYQPRAAKTHLVVQREEILTILEAQRILKERFPENEFEPKSFMVTLNPVTGETVNELRDRVNLTLKDMALLDKVSVTSTASAVDISPKGICKLAALRKALSFLELDDIDSALGQIVAFGDQTADLDVLMAVGKPYCPSESPAQVKKAVTNKTDSQHVVALPDIRFVISVIERECGLKIA